MGPHFFKCGNVRSLYSAIKTPRCFNGAALFQVRKHFQNIASDASDASFNGAALFQVRKHPVQALDHLCGILASMGPHFFKCGNNWVNADFFYGLQASMGPHFFKCGNKRLAVGLAKTRSRFNGAALFQVRKPSPVDDMITAEEKLQWGRTFSSAETRMRRTAEVAEKLASMGPHFFKCGNSIG